MINSTISKKILQQIFNIISSNDAASIYLIFVSIVKVKTTLLGEILEINSWINPGLLLLSSFGIFVSQLSDFF